jgi:A/G-specific adenine glycosylase
LAVSQLLDWFSRNARDLPWRRTSDPYAIWISEIMLQQTQVATVVPYWERWMRELPTPARVAAAELDQVLKLWEGLGYYRRARNLHAAASQIVEIHDGVFPDRFEDILDLPGVGRYTAGAIGSIAFNQPVPILDGNIIRVLSRIWALPGDPRTRAVSDRLWQLATDLVQTASRTNRPNARCCSELNQSLMELGALICTPRNPACHRCPVSKLCEARKRGEAEQFPQLAKNEAVTARHWATVILQKGSRWRLRQRPSDGVNAGLWEFPGLELSNANDALAALADWLGAEKDSLKRLGRVSHSITRFRFHQEVFLLSIETEKGIRLPDGRWLSAVELERLALTSAHRKIAGMLEKKR